MAETWKGQGNGCWCSTSPRSPYWLDPIWLRRILLGWYSRKLVLTATRGNVSPQDSKRKSCVCLFGHSLLVHTKAGLGTHLEHRDQCLPRVCAFSAGRAYISYPVPQPFHLAYQEAVAYYFVAMPKDRREKRVSYVIVGNSPTPCLPWKALSAALAWCGWCSMMVMCKKVEGQMLGAPGWSHQEGLFWNLLDAHLSHLMVLLS